MGYPARRHVLRPVQAPAPGHRPGETHEWLDALDQVRRPGRRERAHFLLDKVLKRARQLQVGLPPLIQSRYINTISPEQEPPSPATSRWSCASAASSAGTRRSWCCARTTCFPGIGGHLSTYASAASLYEVGFNHFFRGKDDGGSGDQIFFQGHAAPGIYARAFLEGRLTESQLDHFRREVGARPGAVVLSAPAADARLLGVPDRLDGPRAHERPSTRRASTATCTRAASRTPRTRACGRSSATARRTSPRRSARSRWRRARGSTT